MPSGKKNKSVHPGKKNLKSPGAFSSYTFSDWLAGGLILLYTVAELVPESGGGEVMGAQWVYLNIINIIVTVLALTRPTLISPSAARCLPVRLPVMLYLLILLLALVSLGTAMNPSETAVNLARLVNSVVMMINLGLLFWNRVQLLRILAQIISVLLLVQSFSTLSAFYKGLADTDVNRLIYSLRGNAGNKNILAASLVIKIPFVIYCIYSFKGWKLPLYILSMATGSFAVFILNARSSYIGLAIALIIFIIGLIILNRNSIKKAGITLSIILVPVLLAFLLSSKTIRDAIDTQDQKTPYGTVLDRLSSISLTAEGSNSRTQMWESAIGFIKSHPVLGCGYGNWKLASIPLEKEYADELLVAYHCHNDFLEITAELGAAGGIAYLFVFVLLALYLAGVVLSAKREQTHRLFATVMLMALGVYFTDAFFNFPMERPVMQFYFALIMASGLILSRKPDEDAQPKAGNKAHKILQIISLVLLISALFFTYTTFRSFRVQKTINGELKEGNLQSDPEYVINAFPAIPDLNGFCYPIASIKGMYLVQAKLYDRALPYLEEGARVNPYLPLAEFFKARIYLETGKPDSAQPYAEKAFYTRPRSRTSYELLNDICLQRKDSVQLEKAFREYIRYRNEAWAWNRFIGLKAALNTPAEALLNLVDSGLLKFPGDPDLMQKKNLLQPGNNTPAANTPAPADSEYQKIFSAGMAAYDAKNYPEAIARFAEAYALDKTNYQALENTGLCYYATSDYPRAIEYFDQVLREYSPADGKSEYVKAICLLNLGKKEEGCEFLGKALAKKHPEAAGQMAIYCK